MNVPSDPRLGMARRCLLNVPSVEARHPRRRCRSAFHPLLLIALAVFLFGESLAAPASHLDPAPKAKGSLPTRILPPGIVCLINPQTPRRCAQRLMQVPSLVQRAPWATFYGVFDLDGDGVPEIVFDYWAPTDTPEAENAIFLIYKKVRGQYRQFLELPAQSVGYAPAGWFLNEPPHPKAIFQTRYGGSSGLGLFYLNLQTKSLDLLTADVFLEGSPEVADLDGDGLAELIVPGRGRDRTSPLGAAILHWTTDTYTVWWPNWPRLPYVIYARVIPLDGGRQCAIVAVLEPTPFAEREYVQGVTTAQRALGVWTFEDGRPRLVASTPLPEARHVSEPFFDASAGRGTVTLTYLTTPLRVTCTVSDHAVTCEEAPAAPRIPSQRMKRSGSRTP